MYFPTYDCPHWRNVVANPHDTFPRMIFADWLDEHDQGEWASYIRNSCNNELTKRDDSNHSLWSNSWMSKISYEFSNMLEWQDGLPSALNLRINRRQYLLFTLVNNDESEETYWEQDHPVSIEYSQQLAVQWNRIKTFFKDLIELYPIREIDIGCCRIFPFFKTMFWYNGSRSTINGIEEVNVIKYDRPLDEWWNAFNGLLRQPIRYELRRDSFENILRGHGDVRLAQCASSVTVRGGSRRSTNSRSVVHTVSRDSEFAFGDNGQYVYRV